MAASTVPMRCYHRDSDGSDCSSLVCRLDGNGPQCDRQARGGDRVLWGHPAGALHLLELPFHPGHLLECLCPGEEATGILLLPELHLNVSLEVSCASTRHPKHLWGCGGANRRNTSSVVRAVQASWKHGSSSAAPWPPSTWSEVILLDTSLEFLLPVQCVEAPLTCRGLAFSPGCSPHPIRKGIVSGPLTVAVQLFSRAWALPEQWQHNSTPLHAAPFLREQGK